VPRGLDKNGQTRYRERPAVQKASAEREGEVTFVGGGGQRGSTGEGEGPLQGILTCLSRIPNIYTLKKGEGSTRIVLLKRNIRERVAKQNPRKPPVPLRPKTKQKILEMCCAKTGRSLGIQTERG